MKIFKKTFLLLASFTLLLSGCSLGGDPNKTMSLDDAKKMAQENPEQLYYTLFSANAAYFSENTEKYLSLFPRYTSSFTEKTSFDLANTPLGGGKGVFDIQINSEGDYQNLQDPKQKTTFSFVSDVMGGVISTDIKATFTVVEKSIFMSFEKANISAMMIPAEVKNTVASLVGKTYGNTWDEIKTNTSGEIDLAKYFTSGGFIMAINAYNKEVQANPKQHMPFQKFIKEENGYFYFEALQSPESIEQSKQMIKNILPFGKTFEQEFTKAMNESASVQSIPFIVAYNPENRKYFIQEMSVPMDLTTQNITKITIKNIKDEVSMSMPIEGKVFSIAKMKDQIIGNFTENGVVYTFLQGTAKKDSIVVSIVNPTDKTEMAIFSLQKKGKSWNGEMTFPILKTMSPQFESSKLVFSNVHVSSTHVAATIQAMLNNSEVVKSELEYKIDKANGDLSVSKPTNAEPFSNLEKALEPLATEEFTDASDTEETEFTDEELKALEAELNALTPEEKATIQEELKKEGITLPQ